MWLVQLQLWPAFKGLVVVFLLVSNLFLYSNNVYVNAFERIVQGCVFFKNFNKFIFIIDFFPPVEYCVHVALINCALW